MKDGFHQYTRQYALITIALTIFVYSNTFQVPFFFDDEVNIIKNPSIRGEPSVFSAFIPVYGSGTAGRPLINFTLALNYAISGLVPWSYHLFNLLIHVLSALVLFGVIRRTFLFSVFHKPFRRLAPPLAFASSLIWAIHPLQTQAVTYTIQRCESFMGLCFLLVFYFAIRGWQAKKQTAWHLASVLAFLAGVGSKEVIVVAPILLFYYDILFVNEYPRVAVKSSPILYIGLALGMVVLGFIVMSGGTISSVPSERVHSISEYWLTQPKVMLHYIRLAFWPSLLSIDYGWQAAKWEEAWPACLLLIVIFSVFVSAIIRRHPLGFPVAWFLLILSPTMIIPLPDFAFEHRMYLPLASIVILLVILICRVDSVILMHLHATQSKYFSGSRRWKWYLFILVSASLCILTFFRNSDYRSKISIWKDAAQKYPNNSRAHANLGEALMERGLNRAAMDALNDALRIEKESARIYSTSTPDNVDTDALYRWYLAVRPVYVNVENNRGLILLNQGEADTALTHFQAALRVKSDHASAHSNSGLALIMQGRVLEAVKAFERAIAADPKFVDAYVNMGVLLRIHGRPVEAATYFKEAIHLMPDDVHAHFGMAMTLHQLKKHSEAVLYLEKTLRWAPDFKPAQGGFKVDPNG
jgi:tetratricopeptide (TPR) repeat protein